MLLAQLGGMIAPSEGEGRTAPRSRPPGGMAMAREVGVERHDPERQALHGLVREQGRVKKRTVLKPPAVAD